MNEGNPERRGHLGIQIKYCAHIPAQNGRKFSEPKLKGKEMKEKMNKSNMLTELDLFWFAPHIHATCTSSILAHIRNL